MSARQELEESQTYLKVLPPYIRILVPETLIPVIGIVAKTPDWNFGLEILARAGQVYRGIDDDFLPPEKRKQKVVPEGFVQMQINSGRRDLTNFWKQVRSSSDPVK